MNEDVHSRMFVRWTTPSLVPVKFLGGVELAKVCSKSVRRTQPELRCRLLLQYTIPSSAVVNQLNINEDSPGRMFVRWMPPSMVPVNFLGGVELAKIYSKSVRRTQSELRSRLLLQYTIASSAVVNELNINDDAPGRMFVRWTPPSLVVLNFLGVEELPKVCSKSVRRTQPELQSSLQI